jgi:hypothetical protein
MSESMDFSDMFRNGDGNKTVTAKARLQSIKRVQGGSVDTNVQQENLPPQGNANNISFADSDSLAYVKQALRGMNQDIQDKDLSRAAVQAIEMLFKEVRFHRSTQLLSVTHFSYYFVALLLASSVYFHF